MSRVDVSASLAFAPDLAGPGDTKSCKCFICNNQQPCKAPALLQAREFLERLIRGDLRHVRDQARVNLGRPWRTARRACVVRSGNVFADLGRRRDTEALAKADFSPRIGR
jgi:hypothetical protein